MAAQALRQHAIPVLRAGIALSSHAADPERLRLVARDLSAAAAAARAVARSVERKAAK